MRESKRRYEETHKEERRAAKKQWARNNRARRAVSDRKYREKHRERIRLRGESIVKRIVHEYWRTEECTTEVKKEPGGSSGLLCCEPREAAGARKRVLLG